jgi:predicted enzyme related to lactoylglutathione lyase
LSLHQDKVKEVKDRWSILTVIKILMEIIMINPNLIILYVDNPVNSASFYSNLLESTPTEYHPTFVSFTLTSGLILGLWSKHTAEPTPLFTGGGSELSFSVPDEKAVYAIYEKWTQKGGRVAQKPTLMDFGYTCVVLDPDGHRLRIYCTNNA